MQTIAKSVLAATCLALVAAPLQAQVPGMNIRLNPRIGLYTPLTDLGTVQTGQGEVTAELSGSMAIGLGVELDLPAAPVNLRLNLDYATGSEIESTVGGTQIEPIETTLLAVVGDIVWRPLPRVVVLQPYLFGGGGIKQYDVTEDNIADYGSESDPTIHFGGGIDFGLGPLALNAEVGDYLSWYELQAGGDSEMQHDIFATVGFSIGLF
jgi:hypothetical protein